jgi:hypothetical protein
MGGRVEHLEQHPNLGEILGVLSQVTQVDDRSMAALADSWCNTPRVAAARDRALSPDSPLVLEVLAAFDALGALYADDLTGNYDYVTLPTATTEAGLRAVRDAVAAAYARPVLSRRDYKLLIRPWRQVFASTQACQPDLGPSGVQVRALLDALGGLSARCHDSACAERWEQLETAALCLDSLERQEALDRAWQVAVDGGGRRVWALVRRSAAEALSRPCSACRRRPVPSDARVAQLGMDAVCGMLVLDGLDAYSGALLTEPVSHLVSLRPRTLP